MGIATSLYAIGDVLDLTTAYWTVLLRSGKEWSERSLIPTFIKGQKGVRKLDWGLDLVSSGDIHRVKEITLHCPDSRTATLEISDGMLPFQFKAKSMDMLGAWGHGLEYHVIGRVIDKVSGRCECFIWDYRPKPGEQNLIAYKSSIYNFGCWRDTVIPVGALGIEVQGFRLS